MKLKKIDLKKISKAKIALAIVIIIYTIVSFINLGANTNPQTFERLKKDDLIYLYFNENTVVSKVLIFTGDTVQEDTLHVYLYGADQEWQQLQHTFAFTDELRWNELVAEELKESSGIGIQSLSDSNVVGEVIVYDENGNMIELKPYYEEDYVLVDEQNTVPEDISYLNCSYFDEVYYPTTIYQQLNGLELYESTHPPLGKDLMAIPVALWGLTPFTYRLMGNIAGILILIVMYELGTLFFKKERYGVIAAIIMALDGMHFVQSRLATIDSFVLLFCLLAFLFMMKYVFLPHEAEFKQKLKYLLFSGIFCGCAISTKWNSAFVILGIAIIFAYHFFSNIAKYKFNKKEDMQLILWCILSFVLVPAGIYMLSYVPLFLDEGCRIKDLKSFWEYQVGMYNYHANLVATHPFTSDWYTWPINYRPIWYYVKNYDDGTKSTIASMGNPIIWWTGIVAVIVTAVNTYRKNEKELSVILLMIAVTWLTYCVIGRIMFIYHYYIALPFVMLAIVYVLKLFEDKLGGKQKITVIVLVLFTISFAYFYPVYSGARVSNEYIEQTKWLESWTY